MTSTGWTCPDCGRWFAKRQTHFCEPATDADAWFEARPPVLRSIYDAVVRHVRKLEHARLEVVKVGVLMKHKRTFAELRPRRARFALSFVLRREVEHPRITRRIAMSGGQVCHFVTLLRSSDVDRQIRSWLTEAYATAGGRGKAL